MQKIKRNQWQRGDIVKLVGDKTGLVGVELGVAAGGFSKRMVDSGVFRHFFGVDRYWESHTVDEYKTALTKVGLYQNYSLLRMTFDEALDLFEDESLDFIYVDGYAYTGQLGGQTIVDWYKKVKVGGVIAGDDYDPEKWPLVVAAVDDFTEQLGSDLYITGTESEGAYSDFPSWGIVKKTNKTVQLNQNIKQKASKKSVSKQYSTRLCVQ